MNDESGAGTGRAVALVLAAWVLSLGVDLFLHAGLLARLYVRQTPFLLSPDLAFRRIPAGYGAFLILTVGLYWLLGRLDVRGGAAGFRWGAGVGLVGWGALALGLWSITTAPTGLLVGWWIGQGLELALAGAVLGAGRAGVAMRRIWTLVGLCVVVLVAVVIVMQSVGWAPAVRLGRAGP